MFITMSLVTSIKDYIEVVHKLIETDPNFQLTSYYDFGSIFTFIILSAKQVISNFLSFQWFQTFWSIPTLIPDIASAMISEVSVFNGSFQNAQTILETPISYGNHNFFIYCSEKFIIGLLNSLFLCLPTSISHIITLRRFVMQGLEAGFLSGLGTIAGNMVWIGSIVFGLRFVVIPWLSLDLFRYFLGFVLIVKYMWDSYTERRMVLEDLSKYKIFLLTFVLSFTEQTTIYPFLSNLSIGSDSTLLESFPTTNFYEFGFVHICYLLGIFVGSLSLLQFTCWFWENPAYQIYMWFISSFKTTPAVYSKFVNLTFLYVTMICAISNFAYFGLDYTLTNPLGFVHEDRLLDQKALLETAFLNTKASDRNTRRNRGRHGRRERWKRRVRRYRTFDASLYDQGVYDLLTLEDLNYGFDRFWLRRKIRNHRVRFRFFPGPWMRSFKKQLSRPRLESFMGPRVEFFRILFEQAYHPEFHEFKKKSILKTSQKKFGLFGQNQASFFKNETEKIKTDQSTPNFNSIYWNVQGNKKEQSLSEKSTLRKFVRKVQSRIKIAEIQNETKNPQSLEISLQNTKNVTRPISSKFWKSLSEKMNFNVGNDSSKFTKSNENFLFERFSKKIFGKQENEKNVFGVKAIDNFSLKDESQKGENFANPLSKKDIFLERYKKFLQTTNNKMQSEKGFGLALPNPGGNANKKSFLRKGEKNFTNSQVFASTSQNSALRNPNENLNFEKSEKYSDLKDLENESQYRSMTLLHPLKFYLQKEKAFQKKLKFYGVKLFRNFGVENNAPYFRVMMKRFFYHYKPTLRWERTLRAATMRKARRKSSRIPRKFNTPISTQISALSFPPGMPNPFGKEMTGNFEKRKSETGKSFDLSVSTSNMTKPTHFYSLVEKRASRYRFQIYKDVLQHWYYSPLNRLLLKLDVDSFIRRQPNSYFLTKNDEKMLHLKRQLLSEYYETLRCYTYMQHYSTMKTQIGGTKSLLSRAYNQQFAGTFQKIRHLFNITPSFNDTTVLKFDQALYNEYKNDSKNSIVRDSIFHEELLADDYFFVPTQKKLQNNISSGISVPDDLPGQSAKILREYLQTATPIRQEYIQNLLNEKNYWELTKFLFRGQKMRGTKPVTNETDYLNQEKNYLLNSEISVPKLDTETFKEEIWIALLKKCQNKLYDQEALKNYVTLKKEKYEMQKQKHEKYLKNRLERMKEAFVFQESEFSKVQNKNSNEKMTQFQNLSNYTSGVRKAMKESILWAWLRQPNSLASSSFQTIDKFFGKRIFLQKTNIRNNRPNIYLALENKYSPFANKKENSSLIDEKIVNEQKINFVIGNNTLKNSFKRRALEIFEAENSFKKKFSEVEKQRKSRKTKFQPLKSMQKFFTNILRFQTTSFSEQTKERKMKIPVFSQIFSKGGKYIVSETSDKNLNFWKKRENALSKRRKIRKTFKRLRNQNNVTEKIVFETGDFSPQKISSDKMNLNPNRQKLDQENNEFSRKWKQNKAQSWKKYYSFEPNAPKDSEVERKSFLKKIFSQNIFEKKHFSKKFQRKRSRLRRYSSFKGRGPIKKRTLREKLKRQFRSLKKYGANQGKSTSEQMQLEREKKKAELIQLITQKTSEVSSKSQMEEGKFVLRNQKQRRTRQMKHRTWKKKKQNFAQKRRKLRKRRRSTVSKIRVFNKKLHRILGKKEIQKWWWQTFFPHFQATTEKTWQMQKNLEIRKQLGELSENEIFQRDQMNFNPNFFSFQTNQNKTSQLQIGDKDYKPLAIPEALRIRDRLVQEEIGKFQPSTRNFINSSESMKTKQELNPSTSIQNIGDVGDVDLISVSAKENSQEKENSEKKNDLFNTFTQNISKNGQFSSNSLNSENFSLANQNEKIFVAQNPIPFYAGWDENLRKFVVTNRLLSRKDCFSYSPSFFGNSSKNEMPTTPREFEKAPLQGMNAATTLYWQIPFTTYDPDQFFALGMDGFSPLGWRNFSLKHTKQTTKPILVKNFFSFVENKNQIQNDSKNLQMKFLENALQTKVFDPKTCSTNQNCLNKYEFEKMNNIPITNNSNMKTSPKLEIDKNFEYRRILKKQKRIKKHPRPPVWFPSGSLSQQVLPVHYIYVFYKRSRLPRDRYIRRRLRSNFVKNTSESSKTNPLLTTITDFTLRKRTKPRRKYHRKRFDSFMRGESNQFLVRRRKFRTFSESEKTKEELSFGFSTVNQVSRPTSKVFQTSSKQEKRNFKAKQKRKISESKQSPENLRVRQLRRRVQRQVFRPIFRYYPRPGGFVWPGDYLRLELVKAPQLNISTNPASSETSSRKIRKKKRRTLQEWQIQPKKYLLEKHNKKVLKKRYEKSLQTMNF